MDMGELAIDDIFRNFIIFGFVCCCVVGAPTIGTVGM